MMITDSPQNEFWFHVSPQSAMPIAGDVPEFIDTRSLKALIGQFDSEKTITANDIKNVIKNNIANIDILRSLIGISDKRMYLELSFIFYKTKYQHNDKVNILGSNFYTVNSHPLQFYKNKIVSSDPALASISLEIISNYLVERGILGVLNSLAKIGPEQAHILIDKLINAKEAQQKLTKRRGHGIEQTFAEFLNNLGVRYLPEERHTNPMARDPNVNKETFELSRKINGKTWAFDLIITKDSTTADHIAYVQGLIHTSDPGQYGVNKSDETVTIKEGLNAFNQKHNTTRELWGLVDGVGFTENKTNTIDKMLFQFDTFIQLKTLYKAALKLHEKNILKIKGIKFNTEFYTEEEANAMFEKYGVR